MRPDLDWLAAQRAEYDASIAHLDQLRATLLAEASARPGLDISEVPVMHRAHVYQSTDLVIERWARELGRKRPEHGRALVADLNELDAHTGYFEVTEVAIDPLERWLAVAIDDSGSESPTVHLLDLGTGSWVSTIEGASYGGLAWGRDRLYYTVADATFRPWQVWAHQAGTNAPPVLVHEERDPAAFLSLKSLAGWVLIESHTRTSSGVVGIAPGSDSTTTLLPRVEGRQATASPWGGGWAVVSDHEYVESALYQADQLPSPAEEWQVVCADPGLRLYTAEPSLAGLIVHARRAGHQVLAVWPDAHPSYEISPTSAGAMLTHVPQPGSDEVVVVEQSRVHKPQVRVVRGCDGVVLEVGVEDPAYVAERRLINVGETEVPAILYRARQTPLDGTAPALLYGYGAYETCWPADYDPVLLGLLDRGLVFVDVQPRGGGDVGRQWYLQGRMEHKVNTFNDYLGVADALAEGVVDGARMATRGMSAGGLLQAVVMSRRPDRWRAVIAEVPFVDVVGAMSDPTLPLTVNEWEEWGNPTDPEVRARLASYSPCEALPTSLAAPHVLVTGALNDPRVLIKEPALWVSRLHGLGSMWRERVTFRAELEPCSHDGPTPSQRVAYEAELAAWLLDHLGL